MRGLFRVFAALAGITAGLLPSGPAGANTITRHDLYPAYSPQMVQYLASKGEVPVVLVGNGYGADLLSRLQMPGYYPQARFVATDIARRRGGYLVLIFDPKSVPGGGAACDSPNDVATGTSGLEMNVQAAFCQSGEVMSDAVLTLDRPSGAGDPALTGGLNQLLSVMLEPRDPNQGDPCKGPSC